MTSTEMLYECKVLFDATYNFSTPGITNQEWSTFLTLAQEEIIKQRLNPKGNKYKEVVEETEKRAIDFSELIKNAEITTLSTNQTGVHSSTGLIGYFFDLPADFFYAMEERVRTNKLDCSITTNDSYLIVPVKAVYHGYIMANYKNPFKKPYVDRTEGLVWRVKYMRDDETLPVSVTNTQKHEIITDGTFTVDHYYLRYLRMPKPIIIADPDDGVGTIRGYNALTTTMDCELSESIHSEIVSEAVKKAAASIPETQRYQINNIENLKSE